MVDNNSKGYTKNLHLCNVCNKPFIWNENSRCIERGCGSGYSGYEFIFKTCSKECRNIEKPIFSKQLGKQKGWSEKSAMENYYNTIQINKSFTDI